MPDLIFEDIKSIQNLVSIYSNIGKFLLDGASYVVAIKNIPIKNLMCKNILILSETLIKGNKNLENSILELQKNELNELFRFY